MQDFPSNAFGLAHLWTSGDALSHAVAVILALMSVAFWYLILVKTLDWRRLCRAARFDPAGQMERAPRQQISRIHADLH
ncbi:MAG: hypothetical protein LBK99_07440, partial [Opitutaceae bacterium]|nr:hypothetical protein [Opitutaceae bacterium]